MVETKSKTKSHTHIEIEQCFTLLQKREKQETKIIKD